MNRKKLRLAIGICTLLICCGIGYIIYTIQSSNDIEKQMKVVFVEQKKIEYGSKDVDVKAFIKSSSDEITTYPKIDTKKLGKQKLSYLMKKGTHEKTFVYEVIIEDTQKPEIILKQETITIGLHTEFDPLSNIVSVRDLVDGDLVYNKSKSKGSYTITSNVDVNVEGTYQVDIEASDINGNIENASYSVIIKNEVAKEVPNESASSTTQPTYIKGVLLVNKKHGLAKDYGALDPSAYGALQRLQQGASAAGFSIPLMSGYRSYDTQTTLYNNYVARDGQAAADTYSARPGYSEHQSGLAFDIGAIDNDYGSTQEGIWLKNNCAKYGFILRYLAGKEYITGYQYEPWHVRYVGVDIATTIMQQGITLEEYLGDV